LRTKDSVFCCRTFNSILIASSSLSLYLFLFRFILDTFNKTCILNISQSYIYIYILFICLPSYVYSISNYLNAQSLLIRRAFPKTHSHCFQPRKSLKILKTIVCCQYLICVLFALQGRKRFWEQLKLQLSFIVVYV